MWKILQEVTLQDIQAKPNITTGAGFWIRGLARIIDLGYFYLIAVVMGVIVGLVNLVLTIIGFSALEITDDSFLGIFLSIIASSLYNAGCESYHGASLGKLICGLRVLREDGSRCSFNQAIIRNLFYNLDALFFGLVGYMAMSKTPLNQRFGDRRARTVVVQTFQVPEMSRRTGIDFFIGLLFGTSLCSIVLVISAFI